MNEDNPSAPAPVIPRLVLLGTAAAIAAAAAVTSPISLLIGGAGRRRAAGAGPGGRPGQEAGPEQPPC
jgi:hypothetical protein